MWDCDDRAECGGMRIFCLFFSSRRRHTRYWRDWSSDVCSSDLPDLIAQIHFAGAQKISADKFFSAFTNEFSSDEAHALASQTLDKLSHVPGAWFKTKIPADAGDGAAQLR